MSTNKSIKIPKEMTGKFDEIAQIITAFCDEKLNEEYKQVCMQLCAALCRKRPSPLVSSKANAWACGIIHTIGTVNFLFDPGSKPNVKTSELYEWFGIAGNTGSGKSKQIRDLMKIHVFDTNWTLPSKINSNPMTWMIQIDGLLVDVRNCDRFIQEEAYRRGLIPFLP